MVDHPRDRRRAGRDASRSTYAQRVRQVEAACGKLIEDGGAQYDGTQVNAATLEDILLHRVPAAATCVFVGIYSHGDSHSAPDSPAERFYFHLPHPAPKAGPTAYRMYDEQLQRAFECQFEARPQRPIVALLNFCRSGGMLRMLRGGGSTAGTGSSATLRRSPLYLMSSCQASSDALVGGLWQAFFTQLDTALHAPKAKAGLTLMGLWEQVTRDYVGDNVYEASNIVKNRVFVPAAAQDYLHLKLHAAMRAACVGGEPDWALLRKVQRDTRLVTNDNAWHIPHPMGP